MQRSLILADNDEIDAADLLFEMEEMESQPQVTPPEESDGQLNAGLRGVEEQMILEALREHNGSRKLTAETLGISPRTLRYKLARMRDAGIEIPR